MLLGVCGTWVVDVVLSVGEDFEWAGEVKEVHVFVHGHEDLDGLIALVGVLNRTHLGG